MNKIDIDLNGVPQTLLLPLLGRAKLSEEPFSPIHDERAIKLIQSLNYDFNQLSEQVGDVTLFWMARAYHFDEAIKHFLKKYPQAVIVNLGAGLETAFYRVDNGKLTWVDIDLPEVIALRKQLLPPPDRVHYIAKSIFDFTWMDEIKKLGDEFFFFAGGLFMYFTEDEVKSIFVEMANRFPKAELIFDSLSVSGVMYANRMLQKAEMKNALLKWGIDDSKELEKWSPHIKVLAKISNFKNIKTRASVPFTVSLKMFFNDIFNKGGIIHLEFL